MREAIGFFLAAVLMLTLGVLLWNTPMGKFTSIIGVFMYAIAALRSVRARPHRKTLGDVGLNLLRPPTASEIVPLAPVLGGLVLVSSWGLEMIVLLAKYCSEGTWPVAEKCWTVTVFTLVATVYHLSIWKRHRGFQYQSSVLTKSQSVTVIAVVAFYLAFAAWLLTPPPR